MAHELPPLPYDYTALEPIIDHAIAVLRADTLDHDAPFRRSTVPPFHR